MTSKPADEKKSAALGDLDEPRGRIPAAQPYLADLLELRSKGYSQAQLCDYLAGLGVTMTQSSMSRFLDRHGASRRSMTAAVTPEPTPTPVKPGSGRRPPAAVPESESPSGSDADADEATNPVSRSDFDDSLIHRDSPGEMLKSYRRIHKTRKDR